MMAADSLSVVLVSAADEAAAACIISEITKNSETERGAEMDAGCIWVIKNKYYRARVRLQPHLDGAEPPSSQYLGWFIEAHIIYIEEHKGEDETTAERRAAACGGAGAACEVRLLVSAGGASEGLEGWSRRRGYELVELGGGPGADGEAEGIARVVEALHAHTWRGLRLRRPTGARGAAGPERFLELLGSLRETAEAGRTLSREARHVRAESLVAAFYCALDCDDDDDDAL